LILYPLPKEALAKSLSVILSEAKDLVFSPFLEILRSLGSLRMTGKETFARGSKVYSSPPNPDPRWGERGLEQRTFGKRSIKFTSLFCKMQVMNHR
jgi:hypothetical protein